MYHNVKLDVIGELLRVDLGHWDSNNIQALYLVLCGVHALSQISCYVKWQRTLSYPQKHFTIAFSLS